MEWNCKYIDWRSFFLTIRKIHFKYLIDFTNVGNICITLIQKILNEKDFHFQMARSELPASGCLNQIVPPP